MAQWEQRVAAGTQTLLSYSQEELLAILKHTLPNRLEVLQDVVNWAVPDLVYGSARGLLDARYNGVVKSVSEKNGYGFISDPSITEAFGADLFVHAVQLRGLGPGTPVNFAILLNKGKPHGYDVHFSDGGTEASAGAPGAGLASWPPAAAQTAAPTHHWGRKGDDRGNFVDAAWSPSKASTKGKGGHSPGWSPTAAHTKGAGAAASAWSPIAERKAAEAKGAAGAGAGWSPTPAQTKGGAGAALLKAWSGNAASGKGSPTSGKNSLGKSAADGKSSVGKGKAWHGDAANNHQQSAPDEQPGIAIARGYAFGAEVPTSAVEMPGVTDRRFSGFVKSFKEDKFGFLTSDELKAAHSDQDIYVHWNHVKEFQVGAAVTFAVILNEKGGLKAVDLLSEDAKPAWKRPRAQW